MNKMPIVKQGISNRQDCPACRQYVGTEHLPGCQEGRCQLAAANRPPNFHELDGAIQWDIDASLGILDWEGY
jgi:hypothetical protein